MSVEISVDVFASLCVLLFASMFTVLLHKKCNVLLGYHQISVTILVGALAGLLLKLVFLFITR